MNALKRQSSSGGVPANYIAEDQANYFVQSMLCFATAYPCESGFSSLSYLKNKYGSGLQPETDMALCPTVTSSVLEQRNREALCLSPGSVLSLGGLFHFYSTSFILLK